MEEERAHLGREVARVVDGAQERPGGDAVQHAEQQVGGREQLGIRPPVAIELAQHGQPALQVGLALGRDLGASRLRQQLVVAVDDAERVGLVATASTTYNEPYNLARRFASLDLLSGGRAGWNIVTTAGVEAAQNFGLNEVPAHRSRYERAAEFLDVCAKLWDSWEDDFLIGDKTSGSFAAADRVHTIDHKGEFFQVRGPLNVPPHPAGLAAAGAGGLLRGRAGVRRALRGGGVHGAADAGGRPGLLR